MHGYDKGSKINRFDFWSKVQKSTGRVIDDLTPPIVPDKAMYLWKMYLEIYKGCDVMNWAILDAYQNLSGFRLSSFEANLMIDIERLRIGNG